MIVAVVTLFAAQAIAQPQGRMRGEQWLKDLKEKLSLTDEQYKQVDKILKKMSEEIEDARLFMQGDREQMRTAIREAMERSDKEIQKLLTPDQQTKFEELKKEQRERMMQRRQRPPQQD